MITYLKAVSYEEPHCVEVMCLAKEGTLAEKERHTTSCCITSTLKERLEPPKDSQCMILFIVLRMKQRNIIHFDFVTIVPGKLKGDLHT
jgi:hypothetical protein